MAGKDKKISTTLSGFLRYRGKELTNRERNAFERELEKDPFAGEAAEGFEGMDSAEIKDDLGLLSERLIKRTVKRQRFIHYRIAASIAILAGITALFLIFQRNKPGKNIASNQEPETRFEIARSPALSEPISGDNKNLAFNELTNTRQEEKEKPQLRYKTDTAVSKAVADTEVPAGANKAEVNNKVTERKEVGLKTIPVEQSRSLARIADNRRESTEPVIVKGKIISSEDNLPIPGASITIKGTTTGTQTDTGGNFAITLPDPANRYLVANFIGMETKEFTAKNDSVVRICLDPSSVALDEVVVVGYGVKKSERNMTGAISTIKLQDSKELTSYNPPQPVNGKDEYDAYIEENLSLPAGATPGQREVVVVSFIVKTTGAIENIKIIRSPGKSFSDEAIRLIKEGPRWKPAEENSIRIDDEVRIRIVFK